jgi:ribosomal protein S18 acetylase RimI-like enzyme
MLDATGGAFGSTAHGGQLARTGMWRYRERVEVEALCVGGAWRRSGLADALLARACEWAESIGQPALQLYVSATKARAIRFYQREGFRESQTIMRKAVA